MSKIKNISPEQAITEIARRLREEQADIYKPHKIQEQFHQARTPIRGLFTGNRFGKTWCGAMDVYWHITKQHPYWPPLSTGAVTARACSESYQVLKSSMIEDTFMKLVPRRFLRGKSWKKAWSEDRKTLYFTKKAPIYGGFIEFKSYDQDERAYRGVARHVIWEDEEAPEPLHRENMARLVTTKGILLITMTMIKPSLWVVSEIYEKGAYDERISVFEGDSTDNPYVDEAAMQLMLDQINDPIEREARKTGKLTWYAGKIYPEYGDNHRILDDFKPPEDWPVVVAIDPHDTKETAVTFTAWSPANDMYVYDELWVGGSVEYIANEIKMKLQNRKYVEFIIDPSSDRDPKIHETESIYLKFTNHFAEIVKWVSHPGSVWSGIEDVKEMLRLRPMTNAPKLYVVLKKCPKTDWQLAHYGLQPPTKADEKSYNPKPMKVKEDFCDCVRGTVMYGEPNRLKAEKNLTKYQQEDKFGLKDYN